MSDSAVICAGIIVADHICAPIDHLPVAGELVLTDGMQLTIGGCAANAAVDLVKLGVRTSVVGRVGEDVFGTIVSQMLADHGVDTAHIRRTPGLQTSQTLIVLVKGQDRRFVHAFGANAGFQATDVGLDLLQGAKVLYVGGYLLMPELQAAGLAQLFQAAHKAGVKTVLDVGTAGPGDYLSQLKIVLPWVDVFMPNDDEAECILQESDPCQQAIRFHAMGAKTVIITAGEHGSILVNDQVRLKAGIFPMEYVDGSGSGDAFAAGFMAGMIQGHDTVRCLSMACAMGASCVRAVGTTAGVFTSSELEAFLQNHQLPISTW